MNTFTAAFTALFIVGLSAAAPAQAGEPQRLEPYRFEPYVLRHASPGTHFWTWWQTRFDDYRVAPWCDPTDPSYMKPGRRRPPCRAVEGVGEVWR
jgi:hypothetical protein